MQLLTLILAVLASLSVTAVAADIQPDGNFERAARAEARRQGWPGYPDSYEDAFLAGARWGRGAAKKLVCDVDSWPTSVRK